MAQRSNRAAKVGRLIETASKGSYRTHTVTVQCGSATRLRKDELTVATQLGPRQGAVSCAWVPPGGLLVLKTHIQRRTDGA